MMIRKNFCRLFFAIMFLTYNITSAQMTVTTYGAKTLTINDGDIISFDNTDAQGATLYFYINNNYNQDIDVRIKTNTFTNASGDDFQFCFAQLCIFKINENTIYPEGSPAITIPAGGTNAEFDKFFNENTGDGQNYPMDYSFTIYRVDQNDDPVGEDITFTYRYNPNLSTKTTSLESIGVELFNTISSEEIKFKSNQPVNVELFNLSGKKLKTTKVNSGNQYFSISDLNSGVYLLEFENDKGKSTKKIIKQ